MCDAAFGVIYPVSDNAAKWQKGNGKAITRWSAVQREIIKITVL